MKQRAIKLTGGENELVDKMRERPRGPPHAELRNMFILFVENA